MSATRQDTDRAILERVDAWFRGALCIAFKSHHEGRADEPTTILYRSAVLEGLGVDEDAITAAAPPTPGDAP